jgi:hypothetical protein
MTLLDRPSEAEETEESNEEPVLKDAHTRTRLLMAKMVVNLCLGPAYPDSENAFTPLIQWSETRWKELREELESLGEIMHSEDLLSRRMGVLKDSYFSLRCRMESMETLSRLKSQLTSVVKDLGETDALAESIAEYKRSAEANRKLLQSIHGSKNNSFFVPSKDLPCHINVESLNSLIKKIHDMMTKEVVPLSEMQIDFSKLAKYCKFFELGYYHESNSFCERVNILRRAEGDAGKPPSTPISPTATSNSLRKSSDDAGNDKSPTNTKKLRDKRKRGRTAIEMDDEEPPSEKVRRPIKVASPEPNKSGENALDFDSDTETKISVSSNSKRKKRVPFTDEEKAALMEGVKQIGVGRWKEILECYDHVFKRNKRTNVNLKDLHRTLSSNAQLGI